MRRREWAFAGLWLLILVGLLVRIWRAPTIAGSYDNEVDSLLYLGGRLLDGGLVYAESFSKQWPPTQVLYAGSAALGSIRAHRFVMLLVDLLSGLLLAKTLLLFSHAGLMRLRPRSLVPMASVMLYVTFSQRMAGGIAGHPHHFANAFLIGGLFFLARSPRHPLPNLIAAGAALVLAMGGLNTLLSPLLLVAALLLVHHPRPLTAIGALGAGALLVSALMLLPYLFLPDGLSKAWAGAVVVPLEWASQRSVEDKDLGALFSQMLQTQIAGLRVWTLVLVPSVGLLALARRQWGERSRSSDCRLLVPVFSVIVLLNLAESFQRSTFQTFDLQLMVVPLVLMISAGMAELERSERGLLRNLALTAAVIVSLIFVNNVFIAEVTSTPRPPSDLILALERDRTRVRNHLRSLPRSEQGFTSPQDMALQWQLGIPASTVGIGPRWSLNQWRLRPSWATRTLGLPTSVAEACAQLTADANRYLVWQRTDPEGPNTEEFLRDCLERDLNRWEDISNQLALETGEVKVFRRRNRSDARKGAGA